MLFSKNISFGRIFPCFQLMMENCDVCFVGFCVQMFMVAQSLVAFQSLKSGKDLKKTQITGCPSGYASLFN